MSRKANIAFSKLAAPTKGTVVILAGEDRQLGELALQIAPQALYDRAFKAADFSGKAMKTVEILAPHDSDLDRIVVVGAGKREAMKAHDWLRLGGTAMAKTGKGGATVALDLPSGVSAEDAAAFAQGMMLRAYEFDAYKTRKKDDDDNGEETGKSVDVKIAVADASAAKKAFAALEAVGEGVLLARDLVNEPANILGPVEFAERASQMKSLGVEIEVLDAKDMKKLGMGAFLGVAQGSTRPPRIVVMKWNGGKKGEKPVAFIGKGVVFDTGGISIKPSAGMEDMKGDMGGAAAVTGLMHALAARKAKANVIGIIGLVENMPDADAQRPGDIVTSMSGQTIEVINTDAEGRLILCDMLWYCNDRFKPAFMVNLATLTGAILVALGHHHAGLFSNDDTLAGRLSAAGDVTEEKVWRMPLGKEYDKMIDSKFADMKNTGGRFAGSITAAQFLKRFVGETPWAHLDVAGTAMSSPQTEINRSWGSGFGVRLLDELVRGHYEK
ncbi:leucyl aminopeptidase [Pararhizobium haloflavum]|uniref:leucyl aminopeptidase n=1 Tax=Pararhizobium haloflavum TaxID=2037914 RepID=UPI000C18FE21|nr:leucyl aminopeptidase [Pararhizobium haloflavum]